MSEHLGRVIGDSVTHLRFRCFAGRDVYVGDLLVAEDESTGHRFLFRVTNVHYGLEGEGDLAPRVAGRMMLMEERGEDPRKGFWDADQRLYKVGVGVPLGYVKDGKFRKAKSIPAHFAPVRRASEDDYAFLAEFMGDVEVGHLRSGEEVVPFAVGIDGARAFPYHVGVFATTGMGKSNLMKTLAGSALQAGTYGVLVIDPHGEYYDGGAGEEDKKGLIHHPFAKENLSVYAVRHLKGAHNKLRFSASEIDHLDLKQLFEFSGPQKEFMDAARSRYGKTWLADVDERATAQILAEVSGFMEGTVDVVKRRIKRLFSTGLLHRDDKVTCTKPVLHDLRNGKVVLVDTSGLGEEEELLVATVLTRAVFDANKRAFDEDGFNKIPACLVMIEEAQRVLGKGGGSGGRANVFAQIAREGRKFKTGLCAITQQPKLLDNEVVSQFNTLFILGLADKRDRDILQDSAKQDVSQLENEIQMLMPGECLITSPYAPFAIPAKVHLYEEHIIRLTADGAKGDGRGAKGEGTRVPVREAAPVDDSFY